MRWCAVKRDQRGLSISVWFALVMPAIILAVGIGVDFSGRTTKEQEARSIAAEAARAGANSTSLTGVQLAIGSHSDDAVREFAKHSGYTATRVAVKGDTIHVTLKGGYETRFLGLIGINELPIEVTGTAELVAGSDGAER